MLVEKQEKFREKRAKASTEEEPNNVKVSFDHTFVELEMNTGMFDCIDGHFTNEIRKIKERMARYGVTFD